jgi:hypothetical protein
MESPASLEFNREQRGMLRLYQPPREFAAAAKVTTISNETFR